MDPRVHSLSEHTTRGYILSRRAPQQETRTNLLMSMVSSNVCKCKYQYLKIARSGTYPDVEVHGVHDSG